MGATSGDGSDEPTPRLAARVILLDETDAVLLMEGGDPSDPDAGTWWFTPGGGLEPGESSRAAAARELFEETGLRVDPDALEAIEAPLGIRSTEFRFGGTLYRQHETYFRLRAARFDPVSDGWTDVERAATKRLRWWSADELRGTADRLFPENLLELLRT